MCLLTNSFIFAFPPQKAQGHKLGEVSSLILVHQWSLGRTGPWEKEYKLDPVFVNNKTQPLKHMCCMCLYLQTKISEKNCSKILTIFPGTWICVKTSNSRKEFSFLHLNFQLWVFYLFMLKSIRRGTREVAQGLRESEASSQHHILYYIHNYIQHQHQRIWCSDPASMGTYTHASYTLHTRVHT